MIVDLCALGSVFPLLDSHYGLLLLAIKMGCCNSRPSLPPDAPEEERTFAAKETDLGYSKNPSSLNLAAIKKNSDGTKIPINKFNTIALDLGLNTTDFDSPDMPMGMFYQKLKEKGKFDLLKLSIVGVLLGRGSEKAGLFFDCVANESRAPLESAEVRSFFDALFYVSAEALPVLVQVTEGETPATDLTLTPTKLTDYIANLKPGKDSLAERYTNLVMKGRGRVTQQDFVGAFESDENLSALVTPFAVRAALKKEASSMQTAGKPKAVLALLGKGLLGGLKK